MQKQELGIIYIQGVVVSDLICHGATHIQACSTHAIPEAFAIKVTIFGNTHNQTRVHYFVSHIRLNLGAIQGYKTRPSTPSFAHQLHNYIGTLKRNCRQAHDVVLLVGCSKY